MITVLDIDIDLFVDPRPLNSGGILRNYRDENGRLYKKFESWPPDKVRDYLCQNCGLQAGCKLPGKVLKTHDSLLDELAKLKEPVHLYHLDSHADLGIGECQSDFDINFLAIPLIARRKQIVEFKPFIKESNFLLYAIACGFVSRLDYVAHPTFFRTWSDNDFPIGMVEPEDNLEDAEIRIRRFNGPQAVYGICHRDKFREIDSKIPLTVHNRDELKPLDVSFDYLYVTKSPKYTPVESDLAVEAIRNTFISEDP